MNFAKYIALGIVLLFASGCATDKKQEPWKRNADKKPWYMPDVDPDERDFYYGSFFHN